MKILRCVSVLVVVASGLAVLTPSARSGAGIGVEYRTKSERVPSKTAVAAVSVGCPKGTVVAGGGSSMSGVFHGARLLASYPLDSGDRGTVPDDRWRSIGKNPTSTRQTLTVWVACAYNASFEYRDTVTELRPDRRLTANAFCLPTESVVGGGVQLKPGDRHLTLEGTIPSDDTSDTDLTPDNGWSARASTGQKESSIRTFAICGTSMTVAYMPDPGPIPPQTHSQMGTACPTGARATGGGVIAQTGTRLVVDRTIPYEWISNGTAYNGWVVGAFNPNTTTDQVNVTAVCLYP